MSGGAQIVLPIRVDESPKPNADPYLYMAAAWKWKGWSVRSVVNMWIREDGTPMGGKSDGVATSLMTLVLQEAGVAADNPNLMRGRAWLLTNQDPKEGFWPASSVNKQRHLSSGTGRFMSDAATAFAALALTENQRMTNQQTLSSVASASR